jgi:hypothetical protein
MSSDIIPRALIIILGVFLWTIPVLTLFVSVYSGEHTLMETWCLLKKGYKELLNGFFTAALFIIGVIILFAPVILAVYLYPAK